MPRVFVFGLAALLLGVSGIAVAAHEDSVLPGGAQVRYLEPLREVEQPPLLVFVEASFWGLRPEQALPVERGFARPLRAEGAAVALVRHRAAPSKTPRQYAEDVAEGVAWLLAQAPRLGFDPARLVLAGHGSGGQLAALVTLDPTYLAAHGLGVENIQAVVPISSLYDLESSPGVPQELLDFAKRAYPSKSARRDASPARHLNPDAPQVLALAASSDIPGLRDAGRAFTAALREAGHPQSEVFGVGGRDHYTILGMDAAGNVARDHILALLGLGDRVAATREMWSVRAHWRTPQFSTAGFWEHADLVEAQQPSVELDAWVDRYFAMGGGGSVGGVNLPWQAIPLEAWLERIGPERAGSGRWLSVTNVRGERAVLDYEALRDYRPVIGIAVGDERELFRVVDLYHTLRRTTWQQKDPETWLMARPLGAFLFFLETPPPELLGSVFGLFALTPESFRLHADDPLAPVRVAAGDPALARLLITDKACVSCHQFGAAGGRAGHIRALDSRIVGGFAEPLESYPAEVWRRYVYDQFNVAAEIGASPVVLRPEIQELLYHGVVRAREER
jgi:acetyl esterase/lipase